MQRGNRFTIFDALEKKGYFDSNPANVFSRSPTDGSALYKGPVEYPKMLYHPEGEEKIVVQAEVIQTPLGAKMVGEQRQLIDMIVENEAEDKAALAAGWHDHPAKAMRARINATIAASPEMSEGEKKKLLASIPIVATVSDLRSMEEELAMLRAQVAKGKDGGKSASAAA